MSTTINMAELSVTAPILANPTTLQKNSTQFDHPVAMHVETPPPFGLEPFVVDALPSFPTSDGGLGWRSGYWRSLCEATLLALPIWCGFRDKFTVPPSRA